MNMKEETVFSLLTLLQNIYYAYGYLMDGLPNATQLQLTTSIIPQGNDSARYNSSQMPPTLLIPTQSTEFGTETIPTTMNIANQSTSPTPICEDTINTCHQYGRTACTQKVYEAWAKAHCALYCRFCTPPGPQNIHCENKIHNCAEFDSGNLCTDKDYYSWAYENCKGYCQFDVCNDNWCEDNADANCRLLDMTINICSDISNAKTLCKRYCNLCNITDGKWCSWNSWSSCDVTCGNGTQVRKRQCTCPSPNNGGTDCEGVDVDTKPCYLDLCPVHGGWSRWSEWGSCSISCGIGIRRRDRHCNNPYPSRFGDHCFGESVLYDVCSEGVCTDGNWTEWGEWSACSVTCDTGMKRRERNCSTNNFYFQTCIGDQFQNDLCFQTSCQVNGGWTVWSSWSNCSSSCEKTRTRTCTNPSPSDRGHMCLGSTEDKTICDIASCATAPLQVRLVGGSSSSNGRLEVSLDGSEWGTVCDDVFNAGAARVVCRMLGYTGSSYVREASAVTDGTGKIFLDDVDCTGSESSLMYCKHLQWGHHNCGHGEDVGVICN